MDAVVEIKNRIPIEDLVAQYVSLKRVGRSFKALCPFHKERTPSFIVSPERQLAYCFGCRKGGDHFKFIMEIEGFDFRGALKFLAERAGVELPKTSFISSGPSKDEKDRLYEIHEHAAVFFSAQLQETPEGKKALSYLKKRDFKEETISAARLGFAPGDAAALYKNLLEKGFSRAEILSTGLAVSRDTASADCADRFRNRLIFPIRNLAGSICAFGGRALKEGDEPKYLNSPETPIYRKSSQLYGIDSARALVRHSSSVIVVEGYMDALTCHQAGILNTVACCGTAVTEEQITLLKRFTKKIIFSLDRDEAGRQATARALELALKMECEAKVAVWDSDAKDPDECLRESPKKFMQAIEKPEPATDYLFEDFKKQYGAEDAVGKRKIVESLLPFFSAAASPVELDEWLKNIASRLDISIIQLYDEFKRFRGKQKSAPIIAVDEAPQSIKGVVHAQEYIIGLILTYPEVKDIVIQLLVPDDFEDNELQNIYRALTSEYNQTLGNELKARADILSLYAETAHADMTWDQVTEEVRQTAAAIKRYRLDREKRGIVSRMKAAEGKNKQKLLDEYQELLNRSTANI